MRYGKWRKSDMKFAKHVIKLVSHRKCEIVYLRGNHDSFLEKAIPFSMHLLSIKVHYIHESCGKQYFVIHGDVFDSITTNFKWVAKLGSSIYNFLLFLNRNYNKYREKRGLPYYSLSQAIKHKFKKAVSYIDDYEQELVEVAKSNRCEGIICGHIHQVADKMINGIHYLNSGDWVKSLTCLTEDYEGNWKIIHYTEWLKEFEAQQVTENSTKTIDSITFAELIRTS